MLPSRKDEAESGRFGCWRVSRNEATSNSMEPEFRADRPNLRRADQTLVADADGE